MERIKLGQKAKDKITGFEGIITGHSDYLTGCDQYLIQPICGSDNIIEYPRGTWFDEGRIEIIKDKMTKEDVKGKKNGCDYSAPIK
jgi:hypothetical protein